MYAPRIKRFFSGKRFPLATPSSSEDQMFFLEPSLLVGRLLLLLLLVADFEPRFGLDDIVWSSPTMPQSGINHSKRRRQAAGSSTERARKCGAVSGGSGCSKDAAIGSGESNRVL